MSKLRLPLFSFIAQGRLGHLSFVKRKGGTIAEKSPVPHDSQSPYQLAWRPMFQACVDLWHTLTAAEKIAWESSARPHRMTGYAWYMSQCLRPNPGIYLPLAGGTMSGAIQMNDQHIHGLPLPVHVQDVWRRQDFQDFCLPFHMTQGARVWHNAHQAIAHDTATILAMNTERWDTDTMHSNTINNSRLTINTAGKYVIVANLGWDAVGGGYRRIYFLLNGITLLANITKTPVAATATKMQIVTIYDLSIGDYVECGVYHTQGAPLNLLSQAGQSPEFSIHRIG